MEKSIASRGLRRLQRTLAIAVRAGVIPSNGLVLDAGCNSCTLSSLLASDGIKVINIDRQVVGPAPNTLRGDVRQLPFRDGQFEVVFCLEVLEHIEKWKGAFAELVRVGKWVVVTVPYKERRIFVRCPSCGSDTSLDGHVNVYDEQSFYFWGLEPVIKYIYSTSRWGELLVREARILLRKYILRRKEGVNKKTKCVHCGHIFGYFIKKELLKVRLGKFFRREPDWIVFIF
ncbi:MAG TPA: class I SAM-dependent methyltransferase [bacterium]|nr:class I SAM-dependent methyltransferase [bacterium]